MAPELALPYGITGVGPPDWRSLDRYDWRMMPEIELYPWARKALALADIDTPRVRSILMGTLAECRPATRLNPPAREATDVRSSANVRFIDH